MFDTCQHEYLLPPYRRETGSTFLRAPPPPFTARPPRHPRPLPPFEARPPRARSHACGRVVGDQAIMLVSTLLETSIYDFSRMFRLSETVITIAI